MCEPGVLDLGALLVDDHHLLHIIEGWVEAGLLLKWQPVLIYGTCTANHGYIAGHNLGRMSSTSSANYTCLDEYNKC
jgi:hypothetical protein